MAAVKSVAVGNRTINIYAFHGEVMDEKKWTHTTVSGGGGGGYSHQGNGYSSTAPVTSTTTTHDQIILRSENGLEKAVEFQNQHLALRKGHRLSLIWGIKEGKDWGPYIAVYNHVTQETKYMSDQISDLVCPVPSQTYLIGAPIVIGFGVVWFAPLVGIALLGSGFGLAYMTKTRSKILHNAVVQVISQLKTTHDRAAAN